MFRRWRVTAAYTLSAWSVLWVPWLNFSAAHAADALTEAATRGQGASGEAVMAVPLPVPDPSLFPEAGSPEGEAQLEALRSMHGTPSNLFPQGQSAQTSLSTGADPTSRGYQAFIEGTQNPAHSGYEGLSPDAPMFARSVAITNGSDPLLTSFGTACEETTNGTEPVEQTIHIPDIRTCEQAPAPAPDSCDIARDVAFSPVLTKRVLTYNINGVVDEGGACPQGMAQCLLQAEIQYEWCRETMHEWNPDPWDYTSCISDYNNRINWCELNCEDGAGVSGAVTLIETAIGTTNTTTDTTLLGADATKIHSPVNGPGLNLPYEEYFVAKHTVFAEQGGATVMLASTINTVGGHPDDWQFSIDTTLADATKVWVEVTVYRFTENDFSSAECADAQIHAIREGYCQSTITCTDSTSPTVIDPVPFTWAGGAYDGVTTLLPYWHASDAPVRSCFNVHVETSDCAAEHCTGDTCETTCDGLTGQALEDCNAGDCYVDVNGETQCPLFDGLAFTGNSLNEVRYRDNCDDLVASDECAFIEKVCVEGAENADGDCMLYSVRFDCGEDMVLPGAGTEHNTTSCIGTIRCMGNECFNPATEQNGGFMQAAIAGSVASGIASEMECTDKTDPSTCRIFDGEPGKCKVPIGSSWITQDCCEAALDGASGINPFEYIQVADMAYNMSTNAFVTGYMADTAFYEGMSALREGADAAINATSQAFTSAYNSMVEQFGFDNLAIETVEAGQSAAVQNGWTGLTQYAAQAVYEVLELVSTGLGESVFATNAEGEVTGWASEGFGQIIGQVVGFIMFVYMIYQIARLILSIIFKCEEEELALGIKFTTKSCHYIGDYCGKKTFLGGCVMKWESYCCYNTPFARIVMEQLRLQGIGGDWGSPKAPNCQGVTLADLQGANWNAMDFSEWYAIMHQAGLIPDPSAPPDSYSPTDNWGGGEVGGPSGSIDAVELNIERLNLSVDWIDTLHGDLQGSPCVAQTDPDLMPWFSTGC